MCPDEASHTAAALTLSNGKTVNHRTYRDAEGLSTNSDEPQIGLSIRWTEILQFSSFPVNTLAHI